MSLVQPKGKVYIKSLRAGEGNIKTVELLGIDELRLNWNQTEDSLNIDFTGIEIGINGYAIEVQFE